jgi:hypothetical protein
MPPAGALDLASLMLTETLRFPRPCPTDPGTRITWAEYPADSLPYERSGRVLDVAPWPASVWVIPDERRDGEGAAVLVFNVTASSGTRSGVRTLGSAQDAPSLAAWQRRQRELVRHDPSASATTWRKTS